MTVTKEQRIIQCYDDWGYAPDKYNNNNPDNHIWEFARRIIKAQDELKYITGIENWTFTKDNYWAGRFDPGEDDKITITNPYYQSLMVIGFWHEAALWDVESDEPLDEDAYFERDYVIGPRQTLTIKKETILTGGLTDKLVVPFFISLNSLLSEVPEELLKALTDYPDWKAYINETALKVVNEDEWSPIQDFWSPDGPIYDPKTGQLTGQGVEDYETEYPYIPYAERPDPGDGGGGDEEETDYTLWIVGGLIVVAIIAIYLLSRPKKVSTGE